MEILIMIVQVLLSFSILVAVHEFGHLLAAKYFGMRVEKFSIGFPPKIFGRKIGETEYSFGALPFGGFVKISGMIDESLDKTQLRSEPKPWEFRSKPAWQRLIVMLGGIIVNVIIGILIFISIKYVVGETDFSAEEINKHGIYAGEIAQEIGFQTGDKILNINGTPYEKFSDVVNPNMLLKSGSYYTVVRKNEEIKIPIPDNLIAQLSKEKNFSAFISPLQPYQIRSVTKGSRAEDAGLQSGDKILSINGEPTPYFQQLKNVLKTQAGKSVQIEVERARVRKTLDGEVTPKGTLGFAVKIDLKPSHYRYSLLQAIPKGTQEAFGIVTVQLKAFGKMFSGDLPVSESLSGPVGIAKIFGGNWDWLRFWSLTGMLSMVLAFMNLLPIPALDGGHIVFLLYEMISGRKPSEKFLEGAQKVGMLILLSLMVFVYGNDIIKLF